VLNLFFVSMNLIAVYMFFEISLLPMSMFIGSYVKGSKINEALSWFYFTMFIGSVGMVAGLFMLGMFVDSFDMGTLLLLDYGSIRECFICTCMAFGFLVKVPTYPCSR